MRSSLLNIFKINGENLHYGYYALVTIFLLGVVTTTSCLLQIYEADSDMLALILDLTGGITGSSIGFIIPALIGLQILDDPWNLLRSAILLLFGLSIAALVIYSTILYY